MPSHCTSCGSLRRRFFLAALSLFPARWAYGRPPPDNDPASPLSRWFTKQVNQLGRNCCMLGDGHELDPGDVRYDSTSGLWWVRLPDPSVTTFGHTLNEPSNKPKQWVEVESHNMRDPAGGQPPLANPIVWFDSRLEDGAWVYKIYCFEPNPQF